LVVWTYLTGFFSAGSHRRYQTGFGRLFFSTFRHGGKERALNQPKTRIVRGLLSARAALWLVLLSFVVAGRAGAQLDSGEIVAEEWHGEPGITETVAQIMAREAQTPPEIEVRQTKPWLACDRSALPQDPSASWLPPPAIQMPGGYNPRSPQPVGTSFLATVLSDSGFIPPDTMGDVSPTQIVVFLNGRIRVYDKTGVLGGLDTTTNNFFTSVRNGSTTSDPRVVWDRISQRWFMVMINTSTPNRFLIAVSSGATITSTSSFTFFQFQQDLTSPTGDTGALADYPSLGVDANALYTGANMFAGGTTFNGTTGWVIRKSDLLAGTLTVFTFRQMATAAGAGPYSPRGVTNDDPASTQGYFIGSDNASFGALSFRRVSTPGGTPTLSANILITTSATSTPVSVPAQGSTTNVEASDDRVYDARIHKNRITGVQTLWCAHAIQVNTSGVAVTSGGRDAARWYQIQNLTTTPTVLQQGTLFDSAASNPRHFIYPSVAMSGQGHMALGATAGGTTEFLECVVAGRFSSDALNSIQAPTTAQTSTTSYTVLGGGRNRWGDYSSTVVDPSDDMTFWSFQEYCNTTNSWAVRVLQLRAPLPATPASCSPTSVNQGDTNVNVVLTGTSASSTGFFDPDVTFPNHIAAAVNGGGVTVNSVTWTDATHITLNVTVSASATTGARTITVTNPDGQTATSASGILTINAGTPVCPTVTTDPSSLTRCTATSASFTVAGTGTPTPTFQWRHGGVNIGGATAATYTIASVGAGDAGTYDCVLTNSCGSATSNAATLTVNTAPTVTTQPTAQSACTGGSVTFTTAGGGTPAPTFQWRKGGVNIASATGTSLTISPVAVSDQANYDCVLTNSCGSATTNSVALTVNTSPAFTTQPSPQTVCVGSTFSLSVAASGSPAPTFQWRHGGVNIGGATASTYGGTATTADGGSYDCIITNTCGSLTSNSVILTVNTQPTVTTSPSPQTVCSGQTFSFSVVAGNSSPAPTFQWRKGGVNISGATASTYSGTATPADGGSYDCVLTNSCGNATSGAALLTVNVGASISAQPSPQTACVGQPFSFSVTASGTPAPTFQWRHNTVNIPGANSATYSSTAGPTDGGSYDCVVTNTCNGTTSSSASLTVNTAPSVTSSPGPQTVCAGQAFSFSVSGTGSPAPTFQWRKGGVNIAGATASTYSATASPSDAGTYDCVLTNSCGSATSGSASLSVNTGPSISAQPSPQTACVGQSFSFTVTAGGSPAPTFQWRHNTVNISGANSATYGGSATPADGGSYDCVVTNTCGSTTSNSASLTVNTAPSVTSSPSPQTVCSGQVFSFSVSGSGSPAPTFQWRKGGVNIPGANASTYSGTASPADAGSYDCVLTNSCASATSGSAGLAVNVGPSISVQPSPQTACVGQAFSFSVTASGTPAPSFQWRHNTANISGANASTYTASAAPADAGSYDCVVSNTCGSITSTSASLNVNTVPSIDTQPSPTTACVGQSFSFTVAATGATSFQWRKDTVNIPGAAAATYTALASPGSAGSYDCIVSNACGGVPSTGASLTVNTAPTVDTNPTSQEVCEGTPVTFSVSGSGSPAPTFQWRKGGSNIAGATSSSYSIGGVTPGDGGSYDCVLTNSCGSATSGAATLTVDTAPVVIDQPADQSACSGGSATFTVSGGGTPSPTFQWRKGGTDIPGANAASLTISPVAATDQGTYDCVLTNACGSTNSSPATLTVNSPVSIDTQPAPQAVASGGTATFTVGASGTAPLSYQWRKDSVNLTDGGHVAGSLTSTLTITPAGAADAGSYDCIVSNVCGPLDSSGAALTIGHCGSADFNHDGDLGTDLDIQDFFACLGGSCCPTCDSADFNGDGDLGTDADIEAFFRVLGGGTC
jgi:hypothetical protein